MVNLIFILGGAFFRTFTAFWQLQIVNRDKTIVLLSFCTVIL